MNPNPGQNPGPNPDVSPDLSEDVTADLGIDADLTALQARLGLTMGDTTLLRLALTHRSFAFENGGLDTNERLEFLGDSVLALVVTDDIFHAHPSSPEGRLAKLRAAAVKTGSLATIARQVGLGDFVLLGRGEAASGGADKDSILADTFEAVLGAVYLEGGFPAADELVRRLFADHLADLAGRGAALDYKTSLQELAASIHDSLPVYRLEDTGPDHEKTFTAEVRVDGKLAGTGEGPSKKQAEQRAAREAYLALAADHPEADPDRDREPGAAR